LSRPGLTEVDPKALMGAERCDRGFLARRSVTFGIEIGFGNNVVLDSDSDSDTDTDVARQLLRIRRTGFSNMENRRNAVKWD